MSEPTLDCQTCGKVLKVLTSAEAQRVAFAPQNYIVDCESCRREAMTKEERIERVGRDH